MKNTSNIILRVISFGLIAVMMLLTVSCGQKEQSATFVDVNDIVETTDKVASDDETKLKLDVIVDTQINVKAEAETSNATTETAENAVTMIDIPIFKVNIAAGSKITTSKVTTKKIRSDAISPTMITDISEVIGCYAIVPVFEGDFAYKGKISEKRPTESADSADVEKTRSKYLDVTQYVKPNTGQDLHEALQALIDLNPKRTLYFPDGEYIISKPLQTSASPIKSTSFYLSDNAVIKASSYWSGESNALITVGTGDEKTENDITTLGSNYFIIGGTLDGNKRATGIKLASGREVLVSKVKIINATVGINIAYGINNGSSDMDIEDVDIIGYGSRSKGMVIEGYDNNIVDVRISDVATGITTGNGNFFRGVSVKLTEKAEKMVTYASTVGFQISGNNWFYSCSTENVATGFSLGRSSEMIIKDFVIRWTKAQGPQTAFRASTRFSAICSNGIIDFYDATTENSILTASSISGGMFLDVLADTELCSNTTHKSIFYTSKVGE